MREAALWISGAALAFLLTAGAFLLLANLAVTPSEKSLPPAPRPAEPGPTLRLNLDEDQLALLEALPDQRLLVGVENARDKDIAHVNVTVEVSSENTALSETRYYRQTIEKLPAGERTTVSFVLDLSPAGQTAGALIAPNPPRKILEIRATTPEGASAIKTVILPL